MSKLSERGWTWGVAAAALIGLVLIILELWFDEPKVVKREATELDIGEGGAGGPGDVLRTGEEAGEEEESPDEAPREPPGRPTTAPAEAASPRDDGRVAKQSAGGEGEEPDEAFDRARRVVGGQLDEEEQKDDVGKGKSKSAGFADETPGPDEDSPKSGPMTSLGI